MSGKNSSTSLLPTTSSPIAIRKTLLKALEEKIIPLAEAGSGPRFIWGEPPLEVPEDVTIRVLSVPPLRQHASGHHPLDGRWPSLRLNSLRFPYIAYLFEGEADLRVGTTIPMARVLAAQSPVKENLPGCHVLELPAPAVVVFPPGVPYSDGSRPHWERPYESSHPASIFWMRLLPSGMHCHLSFQRGPKLLGEHSLHLEDAGLPAISDILMEELKARKSDYRRIVQAQLLALLLRVQRCIRFDPPVVANTAKYVSKWPVFADSPVGGLPDSLPGNADMMADIEEYIRVHLQEPPTVAELAQRAGLSPTHLNRLFQSVHGTSIMRYVMQLRLDAACGMLVETDFSVKEIARLCGFAHAAHFNRVFVRTFQMAPLAFRRQSARRSELANDPHDTSK